MVFKCKRDSAYIKISRGWHTQEQPRRKPRRTNQDDHNFRPARFLLSRFTNEKRIFRERSNAGCLEGSRDFSRGRMWERTAGPPSREEGDGKRRRNVCFHRAALLKANPPHPRISACALIHITFPIKRINGAAFIVCELGFVLEILYTDVTPAMRDSTALLIPQMPPAL